MIRGWPMLAAVVAAAYSASALSLDWGLGAGIEAAAVLHDVDLSDTRLFALASGEQAWGDFKLQAEGRFEADLVQSKTLPNGPEQDSRSSWNREAEISDRTRVDLRKLILDWSDDAQISIGKQALIWGSADGVQVLDVITPRDYRNFVLDEPVDSRVPVWAARWIQALGEHLTADSFLIVDPTVNVYPSRDGLYSFTSPSLVPPTPDVGLPVTQLLPGVTDLSAIAALVEPLVAALPIPAGLEPTLADPQLVTDRPSNHSLQGGGRLQYEGDGFDISGYYAHIRQRNPRYTVDASYHPLANQIDSVVTLDFLKTELFGLSGNTNLGPYILRGEMSYTTRAPLAALDYRGDDLSAVAPEFAGLLGLDRILADNWFVSSQLYIKEPLDSGRRYENRSAQRAVTALLRSDPFGRLPQLELFVFHSLIDHDSFIRSQVSFKLRENLAWVVGTDFFIGDRRGVVGEYKDVDRAYTRLAWLIR